MADGCSWLEELGHHGHLSSSSFVARLSPRFLFDLVFGFTSGNLAWACSVLVGIDEFFRVSFFTGTSSDSIHLVNRAKRRS